MGLTQLNVDSVRHGDAAEPADGARRTHAHENRSSTKPRRPDRAVYVPRALRSSEHGASEDRKSNDTRKRNGNPADSGAKSPKASSSPARDRSQPGTPRRSTDKNFCNVYTPPHLRNQRSHPAPDVAADYETTESVPSDSSRVPNSDSAISFSDNSCIDIDTSICENFYIGDYFANGQLGFYGPQSYFPGYGRDDGRVNESDDMADDVPDYIADYALGYGDKGEDADRKELRRASQEINRSSKRIIKQSFDSDVLVISDPIEEPTVNKKADNFEEEVAAPKPKPKLEAKVSVKREENDWDAVYDETGDCLDPSLLEELTATVGKVRISRTRNNYEQYQTRGQALLSGPYDETLAHVVEVYDFPSEFKTNDLLSVFSEFKDSGFEIKWVDDTHALIVFSSAKIAAEVLSCSRPLVRCRPLSAATIESRNKAKKCAEFLQPYRQRPETCTALARRLVSGALGVKLSTARQERDEERRLITIAREKKRQAALHKEAAWDGSLTSQTNA